MFSSAASFTSSVSSVLKTIWHEHGGSLISDTGSLCDANYLFCSGSSDPDLFEQLNFAEETPIPFDAEWIRVSIEAGYPVALSPFIVKQHRNNKISQLISNTMSVNEYRTFPSSPPSSINQKGVIHEDIIEGYEARDTSHYTPLCIPGSPWPVLPQQMPISKVVPPVIKEQESTNASLGRSRKRFIRSFKNPHWRNQSMSPHTTLFKFPRKLKKDPNCLEMKSQIKWRFQKENYGLHFASFSLERFRTACPRGAGSPMQEPREYGVIELADAFRQREEAGAVGIFRPGAIHDGKQFACRDVMGRKTI